MVKIDNTFENNPIMIGENQEDNDTVLSMAKQTDVWFHLGANLSSCHVVISCDKKHPINNEMKRYCASLVKKHSKHQRKVRVIYTEKKNVRKTGIKGKVTTTRISTMVV